MPWAEGAKEWGIVRCEQAGNDPDSPGSLEQTRRCMSLSPTSCHYPIQSHSTFLSPSALPLLLLTRIQLHRPEDKPNSRLEENQWPYFNNLLIISLIIFPHKNNINATSLCFGLVGQQRPNLRWNLCCCFFTRMPQDKIFNNKNK